MSYKIIFETMTPQDYLTGYLTISEIGEELGLEASKVLRIISILNNESNNLTMEKVNVLIKGENYKSVRLDAIVSQISDESVTVDTIISLLKKLKSKGNEEAKKRRKNKRK